MMLLSRLDVKAVWGRAPAGKPFPREPSCDAQDRANGKGQGAQEAK